MKANVTEYLQEEANVFPPKEEVEDFFSDIDELALAADRLEAKFRLLYEKN